MNEKQNHKRSSSLTISEDDKDIKKNINIKLTCRKFRSSSVSEIEEYREISFKSLLELENKKISHMPKTCIQTKKNNN